MLDIKRGMLLVCVTSSEHFVCRTSNFIISQNNCASFEFDLTCNLFSVFTSLEQEQLYFAIKLKLEHLLTNAIPDYVMMH